MFGKNVILGVTGGIACYKACEVVSALKKLGANVDVIMTKNAAEFVTPLTFESLSGMPVVDDMFKRVNNWDIEHIALAKKADVFVVAPATANAIAKFANGIADDMLSTTYLAVKAPVIIAPAMNTAMFEHVTVQQNLKTLESRGCIILPPEEGRLACGDVGKGKMCSPETIVEKILETVMPQRDLFGKKILVTAGGTIQMLDKVRYLANFSTGKMGCEIAARAIGRGAEVHMILGKHSVTPPVGAVITEVETTAQMHDAVMQNLPACDVIIKAAAPCDYQPQNVPQQKIKGQTLELKLSKCTDIAAEAGKVKGKRTLIVFAAETENLLENAKAKLAAKNADYVVANDVTQEGAGFGTDTNIVTIVDKTGNSICLPRMSKALVADKILDLLVSDKKK